MRYAFIEAHHGALSITRACQVLQVPRSGFYEWRRRPKDLALKTEDHLCREIYSVYAESKGIYGVRKIHGMCVKQGWKINHKQVARLMQAEGLKSRRRRRLKATTDSNHRHPVVSNRLNRAFEPSAPNQKWAGDITAVLDLFSRRVAADA